MYKFYIIYLIIVNVIAFMLMYFDKKRAKRGAWRIPEKTLFGSAIIGGSIGAMLGMHTFRHKTKHLSFQIGMPAIFIVQLCIALCVCKFVL